MATYNNYHSSVSSSFYNYVLSQCGINDDYIIMSTDDSYIGIVGQWQGDNTFKNSKVYEYDRSTYQSYQISVSTETTTTLNISYPYYVFSNIGVGTYLDNPKIETHMLQSTLLINAVLIILTLCTIGFNIIRKRWINPIKKERL